MPGCLEFSRSLRDVNSEAEGVLTISLGPFQASIHKVMIPRVCFCAAQVTTQLNATLNATTSRFLSTTVSRAASHHWHHGEVPEHIVPWTKLLQIVVHSPVRSQASACMKYLGESYLIVNKSPVLVDQLLIRYWLLLMTVAVYLSKTTECPFLHRYSAALRMLRAAHRCTRAYFRNTRRVRKAGWGIDSREG